MHAEQAGGFDQNIAIFKSKFTGMRVDLLFAQSVLISIGPAIFQLFFFSSCLFVITFAHDNWPHATIYIDSLS